MTYNTTAVYGGNITIALPTTGNYSSTVNQKPPPERIITYVDGQTSAAGFTYTHNFTFPVNELRIRSSIFTFINTTAFSTVAINVNGVAAFSVAPGKLAKIYLRPDNSFDVSSPRFNTIGTGTDLSATPSQFIVFGQNTSPTNGTYMYNPVADTWTSKATRPISSAGDIGGDVTTGTGSNGASAPHQTMHLGGTSVYEFTSSNTYVSKAALDTSVSYDMSIGVVDGSTKCFFTSTDATSSVMQVRRYSTAGNSWTTPTLPIGFNHDIGIGVATAQIYGNPSLFLVFGTSTISTKSVVQAFGPFPLTWKTFSNPPSGNDYASASISLHSYSVHVFGGASGAGSSTYGMSRLRINISNNNFSWKTGMSATAPIFGQPAFTHSTRGRIYLMAGLNAATGAALQHQYYDVYTESYTAVASRAWTTSGGYRHHARGRINWMA